MKKHKFASSKRASSHAVFFGMISSLILFLALTLLASIILLFTNDPLSASGGAGLAVLVISGAASAFLTARFKGENALAPTLISLCATALLIFAISIITKSDAKITSALMNGISYFLPGALTAVLATKKKAKFHKKFR